MQRGTRRTGKRTGGRATPFPVLMIIGLAVAATGLAACSSGPPPAVLTATRQVHVSPVSAHGSPVRGFRTAQTVAGANCEAGSEAIGRAYRCFAGSSLYDPCWAARATAPTVLCLPVPWSTSDIRLEVGAPLSAIPAEPGTSEPWGVELASGQRCVLLQGAHSVFAGRVIDYYCNASLSLLRGLTKTAPVWRAASVTGTAGNQARGPSEQIKIAWFGSPDSFY
jgi:hypothetical protein